MQLSKKQTDPTNPFVEKERQSWKRSGQCQIRSGKIQKNIRTFFDKNGPKKNCKEITQQAAQLRGVPTISAKTLAYPSLL